MSRKLTIDEFVRRAHERHDNEYDYAEVVYKNNYTPITINCKIHGPFSQTPHNHLKGNRCRKCSLDSRTYSQAKFISNARKIHGGRYDYSQVDYVNSQKKVNVICSLHGIFSVKPNNHTLRKSGCPVCRSSRGEMAIIQFLQKKKISFERQKTFSNCKSPKGWPMKFDFYIPHINMLVEFDGMQHFSKSTVGHYKTSNKDLRYTQRKDKIKTKFARDNGIKLIRIPYWDINNIPQRLQNI